VLQSPLFRRHSFIRTTQMVNHGFDRVEPGYRSLWTMKVRALDFLAMLREQFLDVLSCDPSRAIIPLPPDQLDDLGYSSSEIRKRSDEAMSRGHCQGSNCDRTGGGDLPACHLSRTMPQPHTNNR